MIHIINRLREIFIGMSARRRVGVAAAMAFLLVIATIIVLAGQRFFPVLVVNGEMISARRVDRNFRAAAAGYERVRAAYGLDTATTTAIARDEMERQVIDQLIDAVLVDQAARREVGGELRGLVAAKVGKYEEDERLSAAAEKLYGIPFSVFAEEVLVPQAERDILSGRLFLKGEKFSEWLTKTRGEASVAIFSGRFRWEDGRLQLTTP